MIYIFREQVLVSDTFMSRDLYNCTHCRSTLWSSKHKEKGCAWVIKVVDICAVWMEINVFTLALSNLSLGWDISHCTFTSKRQNTLFMLGSIYIALLDRFLTKATYGYNKYDRNVWGLRDPWIILTAFLTLKYQVDILWFYLMRADCKQSFNLICFMNFTLLMFGVSETRYMKL